MSDLEELRMYLVVRGDLDTMTPSKLAVQAGHAFVALVETAMAKEPGRMAEYRAGETVTICLKAPDLHAFDRVWQELSGTGLPAVRIVDAGRTCFTEPTPTVLAVGPCRRNELPKFVGRLQLQA